MFNDILPQRVSHALDLLHQKGLREIRIRVGQPIIIDFGSLFYLSENGLTDQKERALVCSFTEMQDIVFKCCECSIYAHNDELKTGFVTLSGGQRVGICGEIVVDNGKIKTFKNFSSISIRIAHQIKNCSLNALPFLYDENGVFNTLIIAPPNCGKTTFLRDLCCQISNKFIAKNVLLVDERGELASCQNGQAQMDVGIATDIYTNSTKKFALENGIRTLAPEVIIMDELATIDDIEALNFAIGSGVKVLATAHSSSIEEFRRKPNFQRLIDLKIFTRIVLLSGRKGSGTLEGVFNENFNLVSYFD